VWKGSDVPVKGGDGEGGRGGGFVEHVVDVDVAGGAAVAGEDRRVRLHEAGEAGAFVAVGEGRGRCPGGKLMPLL
jgi:hypothetical protein